MAIKNRSAKKQVASTKPKVEIRESWLQFKDGKFESVEAPDWFNNLVWDADHQNTRNYGDAGYYSIRFFGEGDGVQYELWSRNDWDDQPHWFIEFSDGSQDQIITVSTWVDLIELLAKLAPIAIATMMRHSKYGQPYFLINPIPTNEKENV